MRKRLSYVLWTVVAVIAAAVLALILLNLVDSPLNPETQKVLAAGTPPNENQRKAYEYLLDTYAKRGWDVPSLPCKLCDKDDLKEETVRKAFEEGTEQTRAYIKLMEFREIQSDKGSDQEAYSAPQSIPFRLHPYFLLQLSLWLDKKGDERVLDLLLASNQFLQSLLQNGTLLERMMAASTLVTNAKFLVRERERRPKLIIPRELIESFRMPETNDIMFGAMEEETRMFARVARSIKFSGNPGIVLSWLPVRIAYRPNDTINRFHHIALQIASTDCPKEMEMEACIPDLAWAHFNSPLDYMVNPYGRLLIGVVAPFSNRRGRVQELRQELSALRESFHL